MKNHSQDSIRADKLKSQILQLEQELRTLQLATQEAKKQWDDQKLQIAEDAKVTAEVTKEALDKETNKAKGELLKIKTAIKLAQSGLDNLELLKKDKLDKLETEIADLDHEKRVLQQTVADVTTTNQDLRGEKSVLESEIEELKQVRQTLQADIGSLQTSHDDYKSHISELREEFSELEDKTHRFKEDSEAQEAELTTKISMLEAKRTALIQDIEENRANDDQVRDNLAAWQKSLEEQDSNLRIREAKAAQQEKAIVRNYKLLEM